MKSLIITAALLFASSAAQAATLTFEGDICGGGTSCTNGEAIDQSYGDIAGQVDVIYDSNLSAAGLQDGFYWNTNYEGLEDVAYGSGNPMSISFAALGGDEITVSSFDIAPYADRTVDMFVEVIDMFDNSVLASWDFSPLSTIAFTSLSGVWSSMAGIELRFTGNTFNLGIDNVVYSAKADIPPIPLPASAVLLLAGLGGLVLARRRRS